LSQPELLMCAAREECTRRLANIDGAPRDIVTGPNLSLGQPAAHAEP
jgi:hypothetical protein